MTKYVALVTQLQGTKIHTYIDGDKPFSAKNMDAALERAGRILDERDSGYYWIDEWEEDDYKNASVNASSNGWINHIEVLEITDRQDVDIKAWIQKHHDAYKARLESTAPEREEAKRIRELKVELATLEQRAAERNQ